MLKKQIKYSKFSIDSARKNQFVLIDIIFRMRRYYSNFNNTYQIGDIVSSQEKLMWFSFRFIIHLSFKFIVHCRFILSMKRFDTWIIVRKKRSSYKKKRQMLICTVRCRMVQQLLQHVCQVQKTHYVWRRRTNCDFISTSIYCIQMLRRMR